MAQEGRKGRGRRGEKGGGISFVTGRIPSTPPCPLEPVVLMMLTLLFGMEGVSWHACSL